MKEVITIEELEKIRKIKGEIRGFSLKLIERFIEKEKGKEGLKEVIRTMDEIGYPIDFKKIKPMDFYPISYLNALFVITKRIYNFSDEKYKEFATFRLKSSFFLRIYMKYLYSLEKIADNASRMWRKSTTIGDVEVVELNKEKRYVRVRLSDYTDFATEQCSFFSGLFSGMMQLVTGKKTSCQETHCTFKGDPYHEFLVRW